MKKKIVCELETLNGPFYFIRFLTELSFSKSFVLKKNDTYFLSLNHFVLPSFFAQKLQFGLKKLIVEKNLVMTNIRHSTVQNV